ncbi:Uu.00g092600.m01.CDS01 [Anthostomella pinea]|uniref:Uu.00g092600.m01.CDS01 n=1 Tax=Anthostomella pinea TaxID=933095 RepID=A0AAI8VNC0_9PEZI|nr:Uu.00g092600.m01.CDS01 [Anthostomella pinea]
MPANSPPPPPPPRSHRPPTTTTNGSFFPPLFQPNPLSTSLIPSTAEGRPIPLDDSIAANRTSALRELSRSQPSSRHRYTKSTGPPSTTTTTTTGTYSQPVLVRTYSGPGPPSSSARSRPASRRVPLSNVSAASNASNWRPGRNGSTALSMARHRGKKSAPPRRDDAKLPPLEAFSFKSIMTDMQHDMATDLDRIAEICARSRYSLSNQYEVHVAPHGSGQGLPASTPTPRPQPPLRHHIPGGPTLQAISSDDEHASTSRNGKRSGAARSRSAAYGTLETIMSSSRSSDEDKGKGKSKKKPAAEIAAEVRGRVARGSQDGSLSANSTEAQASSEPQEDDKKDNAVRRRATPFGPVIVGAPGGQLHSHPRPAALFGEPAKPETSRSHHLSRTVLESPAPMNFSRGPALRPSRAVVSESVAAAAIVAPEEQRDVAGRVSGFGKWIPWRRPVVLEPASSQAGGGASKSHAESSLRGLLSTAEPMDR